MGDRKNLSRRRRITYWGQVAVSATLAYFLTYIITTAFQLSAFIKYPLMMALCIIASVIVIERPRLVLSIVCILLFAIGVSLVFIAQNEELINKISWNPSLLGAGASIIAISIAFYALIIQTEQRREDKNPTDSARKLSNSRKGYVWLEETEKYRCEYCLHSGKYQYYKTLGGIKRHIAKKHAK
jgi:hypothetical protein